MGRRLTELGMAWNDQGQQMEGSVMMFAAVLTLYGTFKRGIAATTKQFGDQSPVQTTWDLMEEALTAENVEAAMLVIMKRGGKP